MQPRLVQGACAATFPSTRSVRCTDRARTRFLDVPVQVLHLAYTDFANASGFGYHMLQTSNIVLEIANYFMQLCPRRRMEKLRSLRATIRDSLSRAVATKLWPHALSQDSPYGKSLLEGFPGAIQQPCQDLGFRHGFRWFQA